MKEHMDNYYFDAYYIILEHHYRTWDHHLCHWRRFDIILDACVYGPSDDLITDMYKHLNYPLMRYLIDIPMYAIVMYFNDLYFVLMMFERAQYKQ